MRERLKQKLRSTVGASLSMALLLFLVCAAVGAVVLAAGTAAAGSASQRAEMDQRYYSVVSAAELVRDALNGKSYTVVREKNTVLTETAYVKMDDEGTVTDSGESSEEAPAAPAYSHNFNWLSNGAGPVIDPSLLAEAALAYVYGSNSYDTKEGWEAVPGNEKTWESPLVIDATGVGALAVNASVKMLSDGSLLFTFVNADSDTKKFSVELTVNASIPYDNSSAPKTTRTRDDDKSESYSDENTAYTKTVTNITTAKTTTIKWTAGTMRVVAKGEA